MVRLCQLKIINIVQHIVDESLHKECIRDIALASTCIFMFQKLISEIKCSMLNLIIRYVKLCNNSILRPSSDVELFMCRT